MGDYHVEVLDPTGAQKLGVIKDFISLEYAGVENKIGAATLSVPVAYRDLFLLGNDVRVDTRLLFYRTLPNGTSYLDMNKEWFVYDAHETQGQDGQTNIVLHAYCANFILDTRFVAYVVGSAQASKTGLYAGNLIKALVRENLGALATDTTRDLSTYLSVEADLNDGYTPTSKACSRRNVLTTCQEVANYSAQQGSYLAFGIVSVSPGVLQFRTAANYWGADHRTSSAQPLLVGRDFGNLSDFDLGYSHAGEVTYCRAGGKGEGAARAMGTGSDATRMAVTPFRRIEYFRDGLNTADVTTLNNEAYAVVRANRPKITVSATLAQTPSFLYGLHFKWGDYLTISDRGRKFDARLSTLKVYVSKGKETITGKLRGEQ